MAQLQSTTIPKWKIALAVGGAVVLGGAGLWYFTRSSKKSVKAELKTKNSRAKPSVPLSKAKQLKDEGNKCFKISQYQQAIDKYTEAATECGPTENEDLAMIYQNRAAAYEKLQNLEAALDDCNRALETNPNYVKALLRRAKIYERLNNMEECFEDLGAVLICDRFENQEALSMYDRVLKLVAEKKAALAIMKTEHARFSRHRFSQLSAELYRDPVLNDLKNDAEEETNDEASDLYKKVLSELKSGHYPEAYSLLEDISRFSPDNAVAKLHLTKGSLEMTTNRYALALERFQWIIDECSEVADLDVRVNAYVKRAIVEQCTGKTSDAISTLAEAQKLDNTNVDVVFHLALMQLISENLEGGVKLLDECLAIEPEHVAKVKKAMFEYMGSAASGDAIRANTILESILNFLNSHPGHTDFVELVGQMYCERGEFDKAEALYDKYLNSPEDGAQNPTILILKSVLCLQWKQDTKGAEAFIENALKIDPQCHMAHEALGLIKLQSGEIGPALEILDKAAACCRSVVELQRILSLRESVRVQDKYARKFKLPMNGRSGLS